MKPKPLTCFAAVIPFNSGPVIVAATARIMAKDARDAIAIDYNGEDFDLGWKLAKARGIRIIKVRIEPVED